MTGLEGRGLAASRGSTRLFSQVGFRAAAGEWLALVGPNGSGKTTLLRCIAGLTRLDAGEVLLDGERVSAASERYRECLVYAGHLPGIKDDLTAEENLRAALALRGVAHDSARERAALDEVGLGKRRELPARRLSAGQRRRIGLARLMLDPAQLWLLDEPATALDDEGRAMFERTLFQHLARGGLALMATHHELQPAPARVLRLGA